MYLSSKDIVEKTVSEHCVIVINGKEITVRRLLNPAKLINREFSRYVFQITVYANAGVARQ
jgi:hypothetical protein